MRSDTPPTWTFTEAGPPIDADQLDGAVAELLLQLAEQDAGDSASQTLPMRADDGKEKAQRSSRSPEL